MSDIYEYEFFFDSSPEESLQIHGWAPVSTDRLLKPVDELIAAGVLRKIEKVMSDAVPREVLVPASRFLPKCDCNNPLPLVWLESWGASLTAKLQVKCDWCGIPYEQELPYGVPGMEHGNAQQNEQRE